MSPSTDLYAAGAILFELLTARRPYEAETHFEVVALHLNAPIPRPSEHRPELTAGVDALVAKLLAKSPQDRLGSARALREEVRALRVSPGEVAPAALQLTQPARRGGTRRTVVSALVGAGVALLLGALWMEGRTPLPVGPTEVAAPVESPPAPLQPTEVVEAPNAIPPKLTASPPETVPVIAPTRVPARRPRPPESPVTPVAAVPAVAVAVAVAVAPEEAKKVEPVAAAFGELTLSIYPFGDVYVDGVLKASEAQRTQLRLSAGAHKVRLSHPTHGDWERTLTVAPDETSVHRINLSRDAKPPREAP